MRRALRNTKQLLQRLVRVEPLARVGLEQLAHQVHRGRRDRLPLGQREEALQVLGRGLDLLEELRVGARVERHAADEQLEHDHAERPQVDLRESGAGRGGVGR